jgi:hypothetical protein
MWKFHVFDSSSKLREEPYKIPINWEEEINFGDIGRIGISTYDQIEIMG